MKNTQSNTTVITTKKAQRKITTIVLASMMLVTGAVASLGEAHAYDLQANTLYANAPGGIYKIAIDAAANTASATQVAATNASLSSIQDIAFDGSTLYGVNLNWQLLKLEPAQFETVAVNEATSFSLQFQGLEARDGVLYGAELRSLVLLDKASAATSAPAAGASSYGLGASELITDLAFADNGVLFATVLFPGIPYTYLGKVDSSTGALTLVGNTGVENINAMTVKDGVIYAMNATGDLYTLNDISGFATEIASDVLPGVKGMDTSPLDISSDAVVVGTAGDGSDSGGSMSAYLLLVATLMTLVRRFQ